MPNSILVVSPIPIEAIFTGSLRWPMKIKLIVSFRNIMSAATVVGMADANISLNSSLGFSPPYNDDTKETAE